MNRRMGQRTLVIVVALIAGTALLGSSGLWSNERSGPPVSNPPSYACPDGDCILWEREFSGRIRSISVAKAALITALLLGGDTQASVLIVADGSVVRLLDFALEVPYCCAAPPLAISEDGRTLALAKETLLVWDLPEGRLRWTFDFPADGEQIPESGLGLAISSDGSRLAVVTMNFAYSPPRLWVFGRDGRVEWSYELPSSFPWAPRFSADGSTLVVSQAKDILVFNPSSSVPVLHWNSGDWGLSENFDLSRDGASFAAVSFWGPGKEVARLFYFQRESGLLWFRDLSLEAIETSLDLSDDGSVAVVVDRRGGSFVVVDSAGQEISRAALQPPLSNGVLLDDGRTLLISEGGKLITIDVQTQSRAVLRQVQGEAKALFLRTPYFALVYERQPGIDSVAIGILNGDEA